MSGERFGPASCLLFFLVAVYGCGDISDVQVPFGVPERPRPDAPPRLFRVAAPQAVTSVDVGIGAGGSCPVAYSSMLPPSGDRSALQTGRGARLVDGDGARVECRVEARSAFGVDADVFDVDLFVEHESQPRFAVTGALSQAGSSLVALGLLTADGLEIDAECNSEVVTVLPGAAWFKLAGCVGRSSAATWLGCSIEVIAIFENCDG